MRRSLIVVPAVMSVFLCTCVHATGAETVRPVSLRCEYLKDPLGIDVLNPRLSWKLKSARQGETQTAYHVLVASSQDKLDNDAGDLWDTGKVKTDQSIHIAYKGKSLRSHMQCFWKVRLWDKDGKASSWSRTAMWSMGLLDSKEWQAKWIGLDLSVSSPLTSASWIWFPIGSPAATAPAKEYFYRRTFQLPKGRKVKSAAVNFTADDTYTLWLNGKKVLHGNHWKKREAADVSAELVAGDNIMAVQAKNKAPSPAGMIGDMRIEFESGPPLVITTDSRWKVTEKRQQEWRKLKHPDVGWKNAMTLGKYGMGPWGKVKNEGRELPARYVRREFAVNKNVKRATAYVCGLGFFDLFVNGREVGNDLMQPGLTRYDKRILYVTYDVTEHLKQGGNAVGVILGNGRFFAPRLTVPARFVDFGAPRMIFQMHIEYEGGGKKVVVSDPSWKITDLGPIRANNEYDGEVYDARMEMHGWSSTAFNDDAWNAVDVMTAPKGRIEAQKIEPMRVVQEIKPIAVKPLKGGYIVDMGQAFYGNTRIKVSGPAGAKVTLTAAYSLNKDGSLRVRDNRAAKCTDSYILKGEGEEVWSPRFKGQGFRRLWVTGWPGKPTVDSFTGQVLSMDVPETGRFTCSDDLINKIYSNIRWTQRMYLRSVPMDPDRDERQGWTGDQNQNVLSYSYSWNIYPFFSKWLGDYRVDQKPDGQLPDVIPAYWEFYNGSLLWPSGITLIPELLRLQYADPRAIRDNYAVMHKWMSFLGSRINHEGIYPRDSYGDWCAVDSKTPTPLLSTAYFYRHCVLMEQFARMQNLHKDAKHYRTLGERTKSAFNKKFLNSQSAEYSRDTQCAYAVAIMFDLVPPEYRDRVEQHFVNSIVKDAGGHPSVGMVGMQWLFQALDKIGRNDVALSMLQKTTFPSWGYMVSKGATSIWEKWHSDIAGPGMNSEGLLFLGGNINAWLFESLAGIRPDPVLPGFKHIIFKPHPVGDLRFAKASYQSMYGEIVSDWKIDGRTFKWKITVPPNTLATVYVPAKRIEDVAVNGRKAAGSPDVKFLRMEKGRAVLKVGSGDYSIHSKKVKTRR